MAFSQNNDRFKRRFSAVCEEETSPSLLRVQSFKTLSTEASPRGFRKVAILTFTVEAYTPFGRSLYLLGSAPELGAWSPQSMIPLSTSTQDYPLWTSPAISLLLPSDVSTVEFKLISGNSVSNLENGEITYENFPNSRKIEINVRMVDKIEVNIDAVFNVKSDFKIDVCEGLSLLAILSIDGNLGENIDKMVDFLTKTRKKPSLKDVLSVCFYFYTYSKRENPSKTDNSQLLTSLLSLIQVLYSVMTEEIEPIVRKTVVYMSKCSGELRKLMREITCERTVERGDLQLGCRSTALDDILDEYFSTSSTREHGMLRVIILNSLRRVLKSLRPFSRLSHCLFLYDVWIAQVQHSLIETYFLTGGGKNRENLVHQVGIVGEFLGIGGVCRDLGKNMPETSDDADLIRSKLLSLIETATFWLSMYVRSAKTLGKRDYVGLRPFLTEIGADSLSLLFPVISRALLSLPTPNQPSTISFSPGKVTGKVQIIENIDEIPSIFSKIIVILRGNDQICPKIPQNVVGIVQKLDFFVCSQLIAQCLYRNIAFGAVAGEFDEEEMGKKVELRVESRKVTFL